jgi:hypothetical protein
MRLGLIGKSYPDNPFARADHCSQDAAVFANSLRPVAYQCTLWQKGTFVILHGRFSDFGLPVNWIVADIP